jgi:hypothetical protein
MILLLEVEAIVVSLFVSNVLEREDKRVEAIVVSSFVSNVLEREDKRVEVTVEFSNSDEFVVIIEVLS